MSGLVEEERRSVARVNAQRPVVTLLDVSKRYRSGGGVEHLSLTLWQGEVLGFLGPNGAGKTTTIRLLVDLIRPDHGSITIFGLDPRHDAVAVRRRMGYLPGDLALYDRFSGRQLLTHLAALRGGPPWSAINSLCDRLGLDVDVPIRTLSRGNRQKVGVIQAFMGHPELIVLDEPTTGLDPLVQHEVRDLIREAADGGASVFLSSHVLSEVEHVADELAMIRDGQLIAIERVGDLVGRALHIVEVRTERPIPQFELDRLHARVRPVNEKCLRLEVIGPLQPLIELLARSQVEELSIREPDLEEVFLALYSQDREQPSTAGDRDDHD